MLMTFLIILYVVFNTIFFGCLAILASLVGGRIPTVSWTTQRGD